MLLGPCGSGCSCTACTPRCSVFVHDGGRCDWLSTVCDPGEAECLIDTFNLKTCQWVLSNKNPLQVSLLLSLWLYVFTCVRAIIEPAETHTGATVSPVTNIMWASFIIGTRHYWLLTDLTYYREVRQKEKHTGRSLSLWVVWKWKVAGQCDKHIVFTVTFLPGFKRMRMCSSWTRCKNFLHTTLV